MSSKPAATYLSKSRQVAQELLARIAEADVDPGDTFATEAELLQQFNVSRPTLREGIRILESQGIVEQRPGPGGGIVIRKPSLDMLAHSLSIFLRFNGVPFASVLTSREVIEPALAAEAALQGTEDDFAEMAASIERMRGGATTRRLSLRKPRLPRHRRSAAQPGARNVLGTISLLASGEHPVCATRSAIAST
jgi:DNA-binding FadR family transcriptional regulator